MTVVDLHADNLAAIPTEQLEEGIRGFAARLAAATCLFVLALAEYDRREAWREWECRSMVHWMTWRCAMSAPAAREHLRVGIALAALPMVTDEFATGALSYSQVRAITRVATPAIEEQLVELARAMTASQLDRVARVYRDTRATLAEAAVAQRRRRYLSWRWDEDGSLVGSFRMPAEDGALLVHTLDEVSGEIRAATADTIGSREATGPRSTDRGGDVRPRDHDDEPLDAAGSSSLDALVAIAGEAIDRRRQPSDGGTDDQPDRYLVTVVAERRVLEGGGEEVDADGGVCQVEDGPGLAPDTVRRLACDQPTVTVVEDQLGRILDVGRRSRRVNRRLRRALTRRDGGCRFPGCGIRRTEAHHIRHWLDGGTTSMANLVLLCSRHHHRHHEGGFRIDVSGSGQLSFVRPDGQIIPAVVERHAGSPSRLPELGAPVSGNFSPEWDGAGLSCLPWIVDGLLWTEGLMEDV